MSASPPQLLQYRAWHGAAPASSRDRTWGERLRDGLLALRGPWVVARTALAAVFRRWLFWILFALAALPFLLFFFAQYLLAWAMTQAGQGRVRVTGIGMVDPRDMVRALGKWLQMNGTGETYRNFFNAESSMLVIILTLAGAILIGNDLRFGSLAFYLSKPLSRWHYLLGKGLAVAALVNLVTTVPALVLFLEYGVVLAGGGGGFPLPVVGLAAFAAVLAAWAVRRRVGFAWLAAAAFVMVAELLLRTTGTYMSASGHLALGIAGYGVVLTLFFTPLLLASATLLQRTMPLIMAWAGLFFFLPLVSLALVYWLQLDSRLRLLDLWNCCMLVGNQLLSIEPETVVVGERVGPPQPAWYEAALTLTGVSLSCLTYLILRIRAVEIVK